MCHPVLISKCGGGGKQATWWTNAGPLQTGVHRLEAAVQGQEVAVHGRRSLATSDLFDVSDVGGAVVLGHARSDPAALVVFSPRLIDN